MIQENIYHFGLTSSQSVHVLFFFGFCDHAITCNLCTFSRAEFLTMIFVLFICTFYLYYLSVLLTCTFSLYYFFFNVQRDKHLRRKPMVSRSDLLDKSSFFPQTETLIKSLYGL